MQEVECRNNENYVFITCQVVKIGGYLSITTSLEIYSQGRDQEGMHTWDQERGKRLKLRMRTLCCNVRQVHEAKSG